MLIRYFKGFFLLYYLISCKLIPHHHRFSLSAVGVYTDIYIVAVTDTNKIVAILNTFQY